MREHGPIVSVPQRGQPALTVIVPVKDGGSDFPRCLQSIRASEYQDFELLVFDDRSTDGSDRVALEFGATVVNWDQVPQTPESTTRCRESIGPAGGRNQAARIALGEILFFIDADVLVAPQTIGRVVDNFRTNPGISAVFGSYDFAPGHPSFISQFRNLLHAFVHQTSCSDAKTFWGGCGAILKSAFLEVGGFDDQRYRVPAVEDIELGYRLSDAGHRIFLDKQLRVKHLKKWTFMSMLVVDMMHRAIPWLQIIHGQRRMSDDLNLKKKNRVSAFISTLIFLVAGALLIGLPLGLKDISDGSSDSHSFGTNFVYSCTILLCILSLSLVLINADFYLFLYKLKGPWFVCKAIPVHCTFYFYSMIALIIFLADHHFPLLRRIRQRLGIVSHVSR